MDIEGNPSGPLSVRKSAIEDVEEHGLLPIVHLLMFGAGGYWFIPIFNVLLISTSYGYFLYRYAFVDVIPLGIINNISFLVEISANLGFGYAFFRDGMYAHILRTTSRFDKQAKYIKYLHFICFASYCAGWLNAGFHFDPSYGNHRGVGKDDIYGKGIAPLITLIQQFYFTINYYICGLWVWIMYVKVDTFRRELRLKITLGEFREFHSLFLPFNSSLEQQTRYWNINHILRTITGFIIILINVQVTYLDRDRPVFVAQDVSLISTYYGTIWLTYLGAGYINTYIRNVILNRFGNIYTSDFKIQQEILFARTACTDSFRGMLVGGFHVTNESALQVGSFVIVAMVLLVRLHIIGSAD
jgi:hypothetical protein